MRIGRFLARRRHRFELLEPRHLLAAEPIITEFQAANDSTVSDGDGNFSDWIEVHNRGDEPINLNGWHLSDDADNLTKWTFPSVDLEAESYLVVFASGQTTETYVDPAGNLHTDFRLSRGGEYLALVEPDGATVASEFAPEYPEQFEDVSYGQTNGRETVFAVDLGASVTALVPSDGSLGTDWTTLDFDDSNWLSGTTGVGFEHLAGGSTDRDDLDTLGPNWTVDIPDDSTATVTTVDGKLRTSVAAGEDIASDRGLAPLILQDLPEPNADYEFVTRVAQVSGNGGSGIVLYDSRTGEKSLSVEFSHTSSFLTRMDVFAGASLLATKIAFNQSGASLRIARDQVNDSWEASYRLSDADDWSTLVSVVEGSGGLAQIEPTHIGLVSRAPSSNFVSEFDYTELTLSGERPFYGPITGTPIGASMSGVNASVLTRVPFRVADDPSRFAEMDLAMNYDDGFVAYLNGVEIARRNAPSDVAWNSHATAMHGTMAGQLVTEVINVDMFLDQVRLGENVLAIQGLNFAADDADFFLRPTLGLIDPSGASSVGYFSTPTPGTANPGEVSPFGPTISDVRHTPNVPTADQSIVVTAQLSQATGFAVDGGSVVYRVMYGDEVTVPMSDDGTGEDVTAGDGMFTGVIPAGVAAPGEMLRYYIESRDTRSNTARHPVVADTDGTDQSPQYYGTVVTDPDVTSNLPILHWFAESPSAGRSRSGTRASVFYAGEFYDNIFVRARGGATNGSSQKFNFNDDNPFYVNDELGRVQEFNLNAQGSDASFIRQPMAFESYSDVGNPASLSFLTRVEVNGGFDRVGVFIEQVDADLMERFGYDPEGAIYKFVQRSNLNPVFNDTTTGVEKKTRLDEGIEDLQALVDGLNLETIEERRAFMFDNLNLPEIMNYLAVRSITQEADDVRKNFYMYRDTNGNGEWSIVPWDKDWTFGVIGDGGPHLKHPFFGDYAHRKSNADQWNKMYDDIFADPVLRDMFLRRLRSVMDELLQPGDLAEGEVYRYEARADEILESARGDLSNGAINAANSVQSFFPERRQDLYVDQSIDNLAQTDPVLLAGSENGIEYFVPTNNDLGLTWTEINPPANSAAWQSGQGGIGYEEKPGSYQELIGTTVRPGDACATCTSIYTRLPFEVTDLDAVRELTLQLRYDDGYVAYLNGTQIKKSVLTTAPSFDSVPFLGIAHSGDTFSEFDISSNIGLLVEGANVLAIHSFNKSSTDDDQLMAVRLWNGSFDTSDDVAGIPHEQTGNPSITFGTIDYSPASGNQDEEYIELVNSSDTAVDISGWRLTGGVEHHFASGTVIPSHYALYVTPNVNAFRAREQGPSGGQSLFIQGGYSGHISSNGETIELLGRDNGLVSRVTTPSMPTNPEQAFLRVSEIHYHPADGGVEFLELVNVHATDTVDATGVVWTDGPSEPFAIPTGTTVPPGGHIVMTQDPIAFRAIYPDVDPTTIFGGYVGGLSNGGERIKFDNASGETLIDLEYSDGSLWPQSADGVGNSLVFLDPASATADTSHSYGWRASTNVGGSPGAVDTPPNDDIVVSRVLANTDASPDLSDAITLENVGGSSVDISGWFLSDSDKDLLKFQIPSGTVLAAGATVTFTEASFNPTPDNPGDNDFALSGTSGDDVWLSVGDGQGGTASIVNDVHFGETPSLVALGRVSGSPFLVPMAGATSQPRFEQLVVSEIQFHPGLPTPEALAIEPRLDQNDLEFLEIENRSMETVDLSDWRLRGEVDADFPAGETLAAGDLVVVVSFNPDREINRGKLAAFRQQYGLDESVRLLGGFSNSLSDREGRVRLQRREVFPPVQGEPDSTIGHVTWDDVVYADGSPWPSTADGTGNSLHRNSSDTIGSLANNWASGTPTPGTGAGQGVLGDFSGDGRVDADDIDLLYEAIGAADNDQKFDLDGTGTVDSGDADYLIETILGTRRGDANLDRVVNAADLNAVGLNWLKNLDIGWASGNFNGDDVVDAADLNSVGLNWLATGAALAGPRQAPLTDHVSSTRHVVPTQFATISTHSGAPIDSRLRRTVVLRRLGNLDSATENGDENGDGHLEIAFQPFNVRWHRLPNRHAE